MFAFENEKENIYVTSKVARENNDDDDDDEGDHIEMRMRWRRARALLVPSPCLYIIKYVFTLNAFLGAWSFTCD